MGNHDRDHYPRRPRPLNRPPDRKPDLAATTPRSRKTPSKIKYVPIVKFRQRRSPESADSSGRGLSVEIGPVLIAQVLLAGYLGWRVYVNHVSSAFFPHDMVLWFWLGIALIAWRVSTSVSVDEKE